MDVRLSYKKITTTFFPFVKKQTLTIRRYRVLIGIGGNVGDVVLRFKKLVRYWNEHPLIDILQTTSLLRNPPFGYIEQNDFVNGVMIISTSLSPYEFLQFILKTEKKFGRKRSFKDAPRTLDIDIIFFERKSVYNESLKIPHPYWQERASVVLPISWLK